METSEEWVFVEMFCWQALEFVVARTEIDWTVVSSQKHLVLSACQGGQVCQKRM